MQLENQLEKKPLEYYDNNISGCLVLLETMRKYGVKKNSYLAHQQQYMELQKESL